MLTGMADAILKGDRFRGEQGLSRSDGSFPRKGVGGGGGQGKVKRGKAFGRKSLGVGVCEK